MSQIFSQSLKIVSKIILLFGLPALGRRIDETPRPLALFHYLPDRGLGFPLFVVDQVFNLEPDKLFLNPPNFGLAEAAIIALEQCAEKRTLIIGKIAIRNRQDPANQAP
jgi:hypothetical protein